MPNIFLVLPAELEALAPALYLYLGKGGNSRCWDRCTVWV